VKRSLVVGYTRPVSHSRARTLHSGRPEHRRRRTSSNPTTALDRTPGRGPGAYRRSARSPRRCFEMTGRKTRINYMGPGTTEGSDLQAFFLDLQRLIKIHHGDTARSRTAEPGWVRRPPGGFIGKNRQGPSMARNPKSNALPSTSRLAVTFLISPNMVKCEKGPTDQPPWRVQFPRQAIRRPRIGPQLHQPQSVLQRLLRRRTTPEGGVWYRTQTHIAKP